MAIPSSGAISFDTIQTEFGGTNPIGLDEYYAGGSFVQAGASGTNGAVPSSGTISMNQFFGTAKTVVGQQAFTTAGSYSWVAPAGVTKVSVVAVGGGGGGSNGYCGAGRPGGGGELSYVNNISVTPGNSYNVVVGAKGLAGTAGSTQNDGTNGGASSFNTTTVIANPGIRGRAYVDPAGAGGSGGTGCGGNGGAGGTYSVGGGGGAAGYSGAGGQGGGNKNFGFPDATAGAGGGGGGGAGGWKAGSCPPSRGGTGGGGVGILGQGSNGAGGTAGVFGAAGSGGGGGSSGSSGQCRSWNTKTGSAGGDYGGGGGAGSSCFVFGFAGGDGGIGAVRVIWPGCARTFPSTRTADE